MTGVGSVTRDAARYGPASPSASRTGDRGRAGDQGWAVTGWGRWAGWAGAGATVVAAVQWLPAVATVPAVRRRFLPGLSGIGDPDHVALTFDDGPDPASTPLFLDVLAAHQVRATFFLLGSMLARAPGLGRELAGAGHEVAVHGWVHRYLPLRTPAATYDDLARARDLVADTTGVAPVFFRPPYGVLSVAALAAARRLRLRPVLWTAWGRDWTSHATPGSVLRTVWADLAGGGTVLLHDSDCTSARGSWRATLGALPALLDGCAERGLRVGPLSRHGPPAAPPWIERAGPAGERTGPAGERTGPSGEQTGPSGEQTGPGGERA